MDIDFSGAIGDITALFQEAVADVTDPRFQAEVQLLAQDAATLTLAKAAGASEALLTLGKSAITARAKSLANVPGLIIAGKQERFIAIASGVVNSLIGFGFGVLRSYAGLPVVGSSGTARPIIGV